MRVRNRELDRSIVFSRDSEPTSCGSPACHLPLLFICLGISLHSFDSYIRGNPWPWNRVAPTTPPRPTATRFQLVIADRSPVRASVLQDGFIPLPPFPLSSFFFFFCRHVKTRNWFPGVYTGGIASHAALPLRYFARRPRGTAFAFTSRRSENKSSSSSSVKYPGRLGLPSPILSVDKISNVK